jgi:hypothetical protein
MLTYATAALTAEELLVTLHTPYVSIRQQASAYVSIRVLLLVTLTNQKHTYADVC